MKNPFKQSKYLLDPAMSTTDWLIDAVIAVGAFGFGCLQLVLAVNLLVPDEFTRRLMGVEALVPTSTALLAIVLTTLPLIVRRKVPLLVFAVSILSWGLFQYMAGSISLSVVGPLIALLTVASLRPWKQTVAATASAVAVFVVAPVPPGQVLLVTQLNMFQNVALALAVGFAGFAFRQYRERLTAMEERAAEAERTREAEASRRVEEERVTIAREVHDITAHSLSAVGIQAALAERLIERDPQAAQAAIQEVRSISKSALEEIRGMIGVLRAGEPAAETAPTVGTERIGDLAAYWDGAGIAYDLNLEQYDRTKVPAYIDVALFGIAREAATNVVRHAQATHAALALRLIEDQTVALISVDDNGTGFNPDTVESNHHGLEGMRDRVQVLQGVFRVGRSDMGGTRVEARIPLRQKEEAHE